MAATKYIFILGILLTSFIHARAQDSTEFVLWSEGLFGIFHLNTQNRVQYEDSFHIKDQTDRQYIFDRAKTFYAEKDDAKYFFQSEDAEKGELIYQGTFNESVSTSMKLKSFLKINGSGLATADKSEVLFTLTVYLVDSVCTYTLSDIVLGTGNYKKFKSNLGFYDTPGHTSLNAPQEIEKTAIELENISTDQGPYSGKFCERLNRRLVKLMDHLGKALNNESAIHQ